MTVFSHKKLILFSYGITLEHISQLKANNKIKQLVMFAIDRITLDKMKRESHHN